MSRPDRRRQVELHTHSTASDGRHTPDELAELCADHDVAVWSLTDHDTCEGCRAAARAAQRRGIAFIPGIEVSAYLERSIHVLGYGIDPESDAIAELTDQLREARRDRMVEMLDRLEEGGVSVALDRVREEAGSAPLSRAHLASVLVEGGHVDDVDAAFDCWIGADAPAYVPVGWPSVPETTEILHRAGGAAILAHPGRYDVDDHIPDWIEAGLDGLEAAHPSHDAEDQARYREIAATHDVLATASSDYHGLEHLSKRVFGETRLTSSTLEALRAAIARHR
ncbi:MAG: PHP domain-containing protein [Bradymonadaceae bacterium]